MNNLDMATLIQVLLALLAFVGGLVLLRQAGYLRAAMGTETPAPDDAVTRLV